MAGTLFHTTVKMTEYRFEDFSLTVNLNSAIVASDVGKALSWDTSAANTMKLAADGDEIAAFLDTFENRGSAGKVGTALFKFAQKLPIKSGQTVAVGNTVVGAGNGEVKAGVAAPDKNIVTEIQGSYAVVLKL